MTEHKPLTAERMFPIQDGADIPWAVIAPHNQRCMRNHSGQTLERIAQRGGLGVTEAIDILLEQNWGTTRKATQDDLLKIVAERYWQPALDAAHAAREAAEVLVTAYKHATATASDRAAILAAECESLRAVVERQKAGIDAVEGHGYTLPLGYASEEQEKWYGRGLGSAKMAMRDAMNEAAAEAARLAGKGNADAKHE